MKGVTLQSNGAYWQAAWIDSDGKKRAKSIGAKANLSAREARARCVEIERSMALRPGERDAKNGMALKVWADRFEATRVGIGETTQVLEAETIRYLLEFFGDGLPLRKITPARATDWRVWLARKPGKAEGSTMAEATVCRHVRTAKVLFEAAVDEHWIGENPMRRLKGTPPEPIVVVPNLTEAQVVSLIETPTDPAWRALLALCALAGLRRGEALRLAWTEIQWEANRLIVRPDCRYETIKKRTREVLMEPALASILLDVRDAIGSTSQRVAPVSLSNIDRNVAGFVKRAGLPKYPKPFHGLRKWRETTWSTVYPTWVVTEWLGHSEQVARKHYRRVHESYYGTGGKPLADQLADAQAELETLRARLAAQAEVQPA